MTTRTRVGFLSGYQVEAAFIIMMRAAGGLLILLSVIGTFYALRGVDVEGPVRLLLRIGREWPWFAGAALIQAVLSVAQWGARQRALGHFAIDKEGRYLVTEKGKRVRVGGIPGYWLVYLATLAISTALNWSAFDGLLLQWGTPWLIAILVVTGADALAEIAVVDSN